MAENYIDFNINNCVRIKLTDHGRKIHRTRFRQLNATIPLTAKLKYNPPKEDSEGWSKWQMWDLIQTFGDHVGLGLENPFDITIQISQNAE